MKRKVGGYMSIRSKFQSFWNMCMRGFKKLTLSIKKILGLRTDNSMTIDELKNLGNSDSIQDFLSVPDEDFSKTPVETPEYGQSLDLSESTSKPSFLERTSFRKNGKNKDI